MDPTRGGVQVINVPPDKTQDLKRTIRIGTYNVRTLHPNKELIAARLADDYKLDLLGMCEARLVGSGQSVVGDYTMVHSGHRSKRQGGVALLMSRQATGSLVNWDPVSDRVLRATFRVRNETLTVLLCYAPTLEADAVVKDGFYDRLSSVVSCIPKRHRVVVMGDFNAKVGSDPTNGPGVMGRHGMGVINDNGSRLIEFATLQELIIGGTLFPHRDIHKYTWTSPDGRTKNQIDHLMIRARDRSDLSDVRTYRGADLATDHELLVGLMSLKFKRFYRPPAPRMVDVRGLECPQTRIRYENELANGLESLRVLSGAASVESSWGEFRRVVRDSAVSAVGYKDRKRPEWMSAESWRNIQDRKNVKVLRDSERSPNKLEALKAKYRELDRKVKRSVRRDRRKSVEASIRIAQSAAARGDSRTLFEISRKLGGRGQRKPADAIRDRNGTLTSSPDLVRARWREYFESVLNRPDPSSPYIVGEEEGDPEIPRTSGIKTDPPTHDEIVAAVRKLKNGRAPGEDGIHAELLKCGINALIHPLYHLFRKVWNEEQCPKEWRDGSIVTLFKKGDPLECGNYRGITLLSVPGKVLSQIILDRIQRPLLTVLRKQQCGFVPGRSCSDPIFCARCVLQQSHEFNSPIACCFIDFEKAFDSPHRPTIWKILSLYGVPPKVVRMMEALHLDSECSVRTDCGPTDTFRITTGVRQGCVLAPLIFVVVMDYLLRKTIDGTGGIKLLQRHSGGTTVGTLHDLEYADDLALFDRTVGGLQRSTNKLCENSLRLGLKVNAAKSEYICNGACPDGNIIMTAGGTPLKRVERFKYLGATVTPTGDLRTELPIRIGAASGAFNNMDIIWKASGFSVRTKCRLFNACVLPILLYGCESWHLTKAQERKILSFENRCLRRILGVRWYDRITNDTVRRCTHQRPVTTVIKERRWSWLGHVLRMPADSWPRRALFFQPQGSRRPGRPSFTIHRSYDNEIRALETTWGEISQQAQNRSEWRNLVASLCSLEER